jgi:hypothetical protein
MTNPPKMPLKPETPIEYIKSNSTASLQFRSLAKARCTLVEIKMIANPTRT